MEDEFNKDDHKQNEQGYFAVIPVIMFEDKKLTPSDVLVYGVISSLTKKQGHCWASNKYLADIVHVTERQIQYSIKRLKDNGYIHREFGKNDQRMIFLSMHPLFDGMRFYSGGDEKTFMMERTMERTAVHGGTNSSAPPISYSKEDSKETLCAGQKPPAPSVSKNKTGVAAYDMFRAKYQEITGTEYIAQWGKDMKLLKPILPHIKSQDHWTKILDTYFNDPFAQSTKFTFGMLISGINRYNHETCS